MQILPRTDTDAAGTLQKPASSDTLRPVSSTLSTASLPPTRPPLTHVRPAPPAITPTAQTASPSQTTVFLKQGGRIWNVAVRLLKKQGKPFQREDIIAKTRQICEINSICAPELGIIKGRYDARHLAVGFRVTIPEVD